jgi:hypothetical protein
MKLGFVYCQMNYVSEDITKPIAFKQCGRSRNHLMSKLILPPEQNAKDFTCAKGQGKSSAF